MPTLDWDVGIQRKLRQVLAHSLMFNTVTKTPEPTHTHTHTHTHTGHQWLMPVILAT
jgi:hypothetical protein